MSSTAQANEGEKILIVDDDARLRRLLERFLDEQGYRVRTVENTEQMDRLLSRELFQLVVLDLMMPGEDGLSACRRLREANNQIPIIMLTAKGDEASRIQGLEQGADDYLAKPFELSELEARVKALLRRSVGGGERQQRCGVLVYDLDARRFSLADEPLTLTSREQSVLEALIARPGRVMSKDQLAAQVFGLDEDASADAIEIYVYRLRKKLEGQPVRIVTFRGLGYMLEALDG